MVEKGVIMQANYGSIIGEYGSKAQLMLKHMLQNNLVHVLGTNSHRQNTIYPRIPEISREIIGLIGQERLEELTTTNPKLILNNKRIDIREPHKIELTLKEKIMMKFWRD
jgi:protein-tyrosine phosphatase